MTRQATSKWSFTLLASAASALVAFNAAAATKVGVVGALNPQATAVGEDGSKRQLRAGDEIFLNEIIETTDKGSAQLMFLDRSALTISPGSAVKVDTFVFDPATQEGTMSMESAKGAFRFIGGALTKKKPVKIKTPVSTIGIRGGIVDTFIARGEGGSDQAVMLFGKEMTMTDSNGRTLSTNQFGTGFTIGLNGPVELAKPVVINLIQNSPTSAAERSAPASDDKGLDQKIFINTRPASDESSNGNGGNNPDSSGGNENSSGFTGSAEEASTADSSVSDERLEATSGMGEGEVATAGLLGTTETITDITNVVPNDVAVLTTAVRETAAEANANPQNNNSGNGNVPPTVPPTNPNSPNIPPVAGGPTTPPTTDPSTGGSNGGTVTPPPPGPNTLPNAVDDTTGVIDDQTGIFLNVLTNDSDPDGNPINVVPGTYTLPGGQGTITFAANGDASFTPGPNFSVGAGQAVTFTVPYTLSDGVGTATADLTMNISGVDYFGNTTQWSVTAPTLAGTKVQTGVMGHRQGGSTGFRDKGFIEANQPSGTHYDFVTYIEEENGIAVTTPDSSHLVIGRLPQLTSGATNLTASSVVYEGEDGQIQLTNFSGWGYGSIGTAANYYHTSWDNGTAEIARAFLVTSPMLHEPNAAAAATRYDQMLNESMNYASVTGGGNTILEYDFLPELQGWYDGATPGFGLIDYNHANITQLNTAYGTALHGNGMLVDYQGNRFIGGYNKFTGANPTMTGLFGLVKTDSIDNFVSGEYVDGVAFDGSFVQHHFGATYGSTHGTLHVQTPTLAAGNTAGNDPIEGFVVSVDAGVHQATQGAMLHGAPTAGLLDNNVSGHREYTGFTGGLIQDNAGTVSRIKGAVTVDGNPFNGRDVAADVDYIQIDADNTVAANHSALVHFGTSAGRADDSAMLQNDLYGARAWGNSLGFGNSNSDGAIISMHQAVSPDHALLCSNCEYAHWGVWAVQHMDMNSSGAIQQRTAMVPYIAGTPYAGGDIRAAYNNQFTGTVNYTGQALGNFLVAPNGTSVGQVQNHVGTMNATINLATRAIPAGGLDINFTGVGDNTIDITNNLASSGLVSVPTFAFSSGTPFQVSITDTNGMATSTNGSISGSLFGPQAREIGGNFNFKANDNNATIPMRESITGSGVFLGKCSSTTAAGASC